MIEKDFDISFVAELAWHEKQIQQNYRPIIAVHKWFARRPGTLFRALLLSEFDPGPLRETFYHAHDLSTKNIGDPFMGGGTPLLEANRIGCNVLGYDINPMAHWIVHEEIYQINLKDYRQAANAVSTALETSLGNLYRTKCIYCDSTRASVKYFLWVKIQGCLNCSKDVDLFPGYLLAEDRRHPKNVLVCSFCGELSECSDRHQPGVCNSCKEPLILAGPAKRNSCRCLHCGTTLKYPDPKLGVPRHRMFAIEYHCSFCKKSQPGRFFKKPDKHDLEKYSEAEASIHRTEREFVPEDAIPDGDETDRLHRWGYRHYSEMFNSRQLIGLQLICKLISRVECTRIRHALATNLSDLLRYQNMLCRYDTMALKSLDIFSVHGFPVGLVQCESNLCGIIDAVKLINIGSGGWSNIVEKYVKAKAYCDHPFEIRHDKGSKTRVPLIGEWIGEVLIGKGPEKRRKVDLRCGDATEAEIEPESLDAVLTDPPYFGNVQYAELMDFCYVWLRRLLNGHKNFNLETTRNSGELTGNENMKRGLTHFAEGLSRVFRKMAKALKPGAPLAFTYHHNSIDAYYPIAAAILDAGLTCSASLPCPAEMGGSIHISGTNSSVIDTVFVCRSTGVTRQHLLAPDSDSITALVQEDIMRLCDGRVKVTPGDIRCIARGHLIRLAIWRLRETWDQDMSTTAKLSAVSQTVREAGALEVLEKCLSAIPNTFVDTAERIA